MIRQETKKQKIKNSNGFTLIELMIVMAIMSVMTTVLFVSISSGRDQRNVDAAAREIAATVRIAQGYALAGRLVDRDKIPCKFQFFITSNAYGVRYTYHPPGGSCGVAEEIIRHELPQAVSVSALTMNFSVPHGTLQSAKTVTITRGSITGKICVDGTGRIREKKNCS